MTQHNIHKLPNMFDLTYICLEEKLVILCRTYFQKLDLILSYSSLVFFFSYYYIYSRRCVQYMRLMANLQWIELIIMFICEITYPHENMRHLFLLLLIIYFNYFSLHNLFNDIDLMIYSYDKIINMKIIHSYENARIFNSNRHRHGLRTPNEDINQRYLKNWADVADKICFGRT